MVIQDLLAALARRLECGNLTLDAGQLCCLQVNGLQMTLEYLAEQDALFVYLNVGLLSAKTALLADILAANLFHQGTGEGAAFGFDRENNALLLFRCFCPSAVDEASFIRACVQMIEVAGRWQTRLSLPAAPRPPGLTRQLTGKIR